MIDNKILLDILVKNGKITQAMADNVLKESDSISSPVEDILASKRIVSEEDIGQAKSEYYKIPLKIFTKDEQIKKEDLEFIPEGVAKANKMISFGHDGDTILVGMLNPDDIRGQEVLRFMAKQKKVNMGVYLITPSDLYRFWETYRSFETRVKEVTDAVNAFAGKGKLLHQQKVVKMDEVNASIADEAPIIKLVSTILKQAVNQRASDIHIEPQKTKLRVRFRLDGDLKNTLDLPLKLHPPVISRIKILANLKIDETRVPQDGRFRTVIDDKEVDYRVATFPTALGEKIAIRVLDSSSGVKTLPDLGVSEYHLPILEEAIEKPFGMILATGPTGSGKSTTLYAILGELNKEGINIVSLEDPVEYFMEGINQSQVKPEIGYDFASGLRQVVRQDPDIIMVGEIRDEETAALATHAALTGHLVLSTLHTNSAIGVVPRLVDMKVEPFLIPASVILMMGQRLERRLCQNCKEKNDPSPQVIEEIEKALKDLPESIKKDFLAPHTTYIAKGCDQCGFKGVKGRIGIFEMLKMTKELEKAILSDAGESSMEEIAKKQGMITLRQDGVIKALKGLVSIESILKETV